MNVIHIETPKTARIFSAGSMNSDEIWIVLHGYGMSAERFIGNFEAVVNKGVLVVAPEGLSRFYRKGFSGDVVASWMTREDRLLEIQDYIRYLDNVYSELIKPGTGFKKVVVFGFSQGSATASRWVMNSRFHIDEWVAWCGDIVPDNPLWEQKSTRIWYVYSENDEFIPVEKALDQVKMLEDKGFKANSFSFPEGHEIPESQLIKLYEMIHHKH